MALFITITLYIFSLLSVSFAIPDRTTITAPLSIAHHHSYDLSERLRHLAAASLNRARHLKNSTTQSSDLVKTPLFPRSYGAYSVSLRFGSPPQTLPFIMDTGSSLVWFPCTSRYLCFMCNSGSKIKTFSPELSSTSEIVPCSSSKCDAVFGPDVRSQCGDSESCPAYDLRYGTGSTSGFLLTETLTFPGRKVRDFLVGCSVLSADLPSGIAGFGRGNESLPAQMGLKKFSYCSLSHRFDDTPTSTDLILDSGAGGDTNVAGLNYTPFHKNPVTGNSAFREYYYLTLRQVVVGDEVLNVPDNYMVPGPDGNGGTIVDSGTTFTYMERPLFELVAMEFEKQMSQYGRAVDAEMLSGLHPCFDVSGGESVSFPKLTFRFDFGAKMVLPVADYFSAVGRGGAVCLTIVTDGVVGLGSGPAIILGNYQQQDFYVEYDLENDRFGFKRQTCR